MRDFLLEPEPAKAEVYRTQLNDLHREMDAEMGAYARLLAPAGRDTFSSLSRRLTDFWTSLDPVFGWSGEERRQRGYAFARDEVLPRRAAMLGLAGSDRRH